MTAPPIPGDQAFPREVAGFRLRRELGRGGMGIVYEAEEIASGRRVALKVLLADLAVSEEAYERFQREARLAAAISHAQCVFVYGAHQVDGAPAIAMEIVDGETLEQKIARGEPIAVEIAVRWAIDLVDGLEAAHRAGVLHRDVKPSNCFVTPEGRVKVGDFGLSRTLERDAQLTRTGQFLGSPLYASPEQVRGRAIDERSDMYSCAATLYAVLSGRAPYSGSNVGEVLARILSEPPDSLRATRPEIPAALESVVLRAMERDPTDRYADLAEFREALAPFVTTARVNASPWKRVGAYMLDSILLGFASSGILVAQSAMGFGFLANSNEPGDVPTLVFRLLTFLAGVTYFGLAEGRFGTTLAKWTFGLRVVSTRTRERTFAGATLRFAVFAAPGMLLQFLGFWVARTPEQLTLISGLGPMLVPFAMFSTARRANGWRGLHEFASGTVVLPAPVPFRRERPAEPPPELALEPRGDLPENVGHYAVQGVVGSTARGRIWKAHDAGLERSVWIHVPNDDRDLDDGIRQTSERPTRLRWIGIVSTPRGPGEVFESPGGTSLLAFAASGRRLEWWRSEQLVAELVDELRHELGTSSRYAIEQVWIDRNWNLRLLDEPIGTGAARDLSSMELVGATARTLFADEANGRPVPRDLPFRAEPVVLRLMGVGQRFENLDEVSRALDQIERGPSIVQARTRVSQLAVGAVIPALFVVFLMLIVLIVTPLMRDASESARLFEQLQQDLKAREEMNPVLILTDDERAVREVLIAHALGNLQNSSIRLSLDGKDEALVNRILANHPSPTDEEVERARSKLANEGPRETDHAVLQAVNRPSALAVTFAAGMCALWGCCALPLAFVLRGGLTLSMFGLRVRDRRGRRASRLTCLARTAIAWLAVFAPAFGAFYLVAVGQDPAGAACGGVILAIWIAALAHAMTNPAQSIVDRLLGTRLVPR